MARTPRLAFVDDRVVMSFEDDRDDEVFAIFATVFDGRLARLTDDVRATFGDAVSARGRIAVGDLTIGIAYEDQRSPGLTEVFFTQLLCVDPGAVD